MDKKGSKLSVALGITFVWFTTQFGGGFASGAQLKSYFIRYGVYCLFTCIGAQAICAVYNAYIAYFARKHGTYDYRSFNKAFYGKAFSKVEYMGEVSVICQLPFGAISAYVNHYSSPRREWNVGLSIGWQLFNYRFIE